MLTEREIKRQLNNDIDWEPEDASDTEWDLIEKIREELIESRMGLSDMDVENDDFSYGDWDDEDDE